MYYNKTFIDNQTQKSDYSYWHIES